MKKALNKLLIICTVLSLLIGTSLVASADGTVTYDGTAKEFIFAPGSDLSPTDLFSDFKNVMPGDSLTQKVTINNKIEKDVKINVYMRSLGAQEGSEEFLSQMTLDVAYSGKPEMAKMFSAPADQTAQLTDWVLLGTVYSGGVIDLDVTLNIPIELGNDFQAAIGYLDWQFKVEEMPVEPDDPLPPTGDTSPVMLYIMLMILSAAAIVLFVIKKRKNATAA